MLQFWKLTPPKSKSSASNFILTWEKCPKAQDSRNILPERNRILAFDILKFLTKSEKISKIYSIQLWIISFFGQIDSFISIFRAISWDFNRFLDTFLTPPKSQSLASSFILTFEEIAPKHLLWKLVQLYFATRQMNFWWSKVAVWSKWSLSPQLASFSLTSWLRQLSILINEIA